MNDAVESEIVVWNCGNGRGARNIAPEFRRVGRSKIKRETRDAKTIHSVKAFDVMLTSSLLKRHLSSTNHKIRLRDTFKTVERMRWCFRERFRHVCGLQVTSNYSTGVNNVLVPAAVLLDHGINP